jgi:hypothetical protein
MWASSQARAGGGSLVSARRRAPRGWHRRPRWTPQRRCSWMQQLQSPSGPWVGAGCVSAAAHTREGCPEGRRDEILAEELPQCVLWRWCWGLDLGCSKSRQTPTHPSIHVVNAQWRGAMVSIASTTCRRIVTLSWSRTPRRRVCVRGWYDSATEVQRAPTASVSRPMPHALRNRIRKRGVTASRRVWSAIDWVRPHRQAPCLTTSPPNVRGNSSDPATRFCGGAGSGG